MIKQKKTLTKDEVQKLLFNFAGFSVLIGVGLYILSSAFVREEIAQCSKRFPVATELSFRSSEGTQLTPIEFQSVLSGESQNILENTEFVEVDGNQSGVALKVRMGDKSIHDADGEQQISGVKFRWAPSSYDNSGTGCLTYKVMLPEDFDFSRAGALPGFHGEGDTKNDDGKAQDFKFVSRVNWGQNGEISVRFVRDGEERKMKPVGWGSSRRFKPGQWVDLEQEFVANSPTEADGMYRLWVNGELVMDQEHVAWAPAGTAQLLGITGAVGYTPRKKNRGRADDQNDDTKSRVHFVHVTPFQFRWQ